MLIKKYEEKTIFKYDVFFLVEHEHMMIVII